MTRAKPPHLHVKFLRRNRVTLSDPMARRLNAFHERIPSISKATLQRIARKDPRILEITPDTFASNVRRTSNLLNAVLPAFFKLARHQPALIYQDPWSLRLKLRRMAKSLDIRPKDLIPTIWRKPTLLSRSDAYFVTAIEAFSARFEIGLAPTRKMFLRHPSLWTVSLSRIEYNVAEAATLLSLSPAAYVKAAVAQPQLFYQNPQTILRNVTDSARNLNIPFPSYLSIVLGQPSLFSRSPLGMHRKARLIKTLLRYTRDERTFEDFLHTAKSALTYSPPHILARCLIARWKLSTTKANTLLTMSNKDATALLRAHLKARMGRAAYPVYKRWKGVGLITTDWKT